MRLPWSIVIAAALVGASSAAAQPHLTVPEGTRFDMGKVYRGTVAERTLTLKNTGNDTLIIEHVNTSCGCTGTILKSNKIAPGDTSTLDIRFDSKNFSGDVHKSVGIYSNGSEGGLTTIQFSATVFEEVHLAPQTLMFTNAEPNRSSELTIIVTNNGEKPLLLTGYHTTLAGLTVNLPHDPIPTGGTDTLHVVFLPQSVKSLVSEELFITTNNVHMPEVYIRVFASVKEFKFE
jgi:hypothetical protein